MEGEERGEGERRQPAVPTGFIKMEKERPDRHHLCPKVLTTLPQKATDMGTRFGEGGKGSASEGRKRGKLAVPCSALSSALSSRGVVAGYLA